jgi:death on curing protein
MTPDFLRVEDVLFIHADQIEQYGGDPGMRDAQLLLSAIAMPQATFEGAFLHRDLFEMAAAYLFHIAQNHPFIDGNKRTGVASAIVFLELNEIQLETDEDALYTLVMDVAQGLADKDRIASFFRQNSHE